MRDRRRRLFALALSVAALLAVAILDGDDWRWPDQRAEHSAKLGGDAAKRSDGHWEAAGVKSALPKKISLPQTTSSGGNGDDRALLRERFGPLLSESEKVLLVSSLFVATSLLESAGVPYFLYGGTLLGSVRHHGLVPWDDDVDIMVNASQRDLVRAALSGRTDYALDSSYPYTYKWYSLNAAAGAKPVPSAAGGRQFRWPYVDVFFFEENATHVHDSETVYSPEFVYRKADVFPLRRRPFEGSWLWTPRNSEAVLATTYDVSQCQTAGYMHRNEAYVDKPARLTVECARLHEWFPFAFCNRTATADESERAKNSRCVEESLVIGGRMIHTLRMDESEDLSHVS